MIHLSKQRAKLVHVQSLCCRALLAGLHHGALLAGLHRRTPRWWLSTPTRRLRLRLRLRLLLLLILMLLLLLLLLLLLPRWGLCGCRRSRPVRLGLWGRVLGRDWGSKKRLGVRLAKHGRGL